MHITKILLLYIFFTTILLANESSKKEIIKVAIPKYFPPQYQLDKNGKPIGFAIDVIEELAKRENFQIEYIIKDTWPQTLEVLYSGKADIIPNMGIIESRKKLSLFTIPMETFRISAFKRADAVNIKSIEDIKSVKVVVVKDNIGEKLTQNHPKELLEILNSKEDALFALLSGEVDIFIYPEPVVKKMLQDTHLEDKVVMCDKPIKEVKRGIQINKNRPKLAKRLDLALQKFLKTKEYMEIYTKWYAKPTPYWNTKRVILILEVFGIILLILIIIIYIQTKSKQKIKQINQKLNLTNMELKQKQLELKEKSESLERAQKIANLGNWEWDIVNNKLYWSDQIYRIFGLKPKEFKATYEAFLSRVHPEDIILVEKAVSEALRNNIKYKITHRILLKDKSEKIVQERGQVIFKEIGNERKPILMSGTVQDITEIEKIKQELKNLNKNLEQKVIQEVKARRKQEELLIQQSKMATMGEMIGAIAHQWKQPLNLIALYTQDLTFAFEDGELNRESIEEFEENILQQINYMSQTITDFRNFFKPSKEKKEFLACEATMEVYKLLEAKLKKHNVKLIINKHKHFLALGYPNEFKQVILNIINNAIDVFDSKEMVDGEINILIKDENKKGIIIIRDNGGGIPKELLPNKLFEAYVSTKGDKGTGIGLQIAKYIIEDKMDGTISAQNIENGAEFIIELPIYAKN